MRNALIVIAFVLAIRLPFLDMAFQGDDRDYLAAAQYAQINPAHPLHLRFVFQGDWVTMRGHPHPPLNVWFQSAILAATGDIREPVYHGAYLLFSIIAALAALSIARRFTERPLLAVLLFLATPAFVINGTSIESDLPFLAFWLLAIACFLAGRLGWAALAMIPAALTAFQSIVLIPILAAYLWLHDRQNKRAWAVLLSVPAVLASWQIFELLTSEALPAQSLIGYFQQYGLQRIPNKLRNAAALASHLLWVCQPAMAAALIVPAWRMRNRFLEAWIGIFFAAALIIFFAGSARYLLPMLLPVAILTSNCPAPWRIGTLVFQLAVSLALAWANAEHWNAYRTAIARWSPQFEHKRVWINGEWGLRHYAEEAGAMSLVKGQAVRPGDLIVSSRLALPISISTGGGTLALVEERPVRPVIPLCIVGLDSKSAYSTAGKGFRPFDLCSGPIDIIRLEKVVEHAPVLSQVPMAAPEAAQQIVSGIDKVEDNRFRWMGRRGIILLKTPAQPGPIEADFYIPPDAPAREVTMMVDGAVIARQRYDKPGRYQLRGTGSVRPPIATLTIEVDRTYSVPGDSRVLGMILSSVGFVNGTPP